MNDVIKIIIKLHYNHRIKQCNEEYRKRCFVLYDYNNKFIMLILDGLSLYGDEYNYRSRDSQWGVNIYTLNENDPVAVLPKNYW